MMNKINAGMSWSGGKDSCLALYKALNSGIKIKKLINFYSKETGRCCFHGIDARLLELQAKLIGIPLLQHSMPVDMKDYEEQFKIAVKGVKGIDSMVFGDIYLDEHKDWVERVCNDIGIKAIEPIWNQPTVRLMKEFIDAGFKTVIISCQAEKFSQDFAGRIYDYNVLDELVGRKICPCGENGEFHTLVIDGPIFKRPIEIIESETVLRDGCWKRWQYEIKRFK